MNVIVDYGNSSAKVGIFTNHSLLEKRIFTEPAKLKAFLQNYSGDHLIISSVNIDPNHIASWVKDFKTTFILNEHLPLPIQNNYASPSTLGVDRIAAVCGAQQLFPAKNCLAIDAGTCITYDFIDQHGVYHGGAISPGLKMRFEAMHNYTARLPLVDAIENPQLVANNTTSCIQSGVILGIIEEIEGFIGRYEEKFEKLQPILCGGDTPFFENKLKASIFASPELVLSGLNSILIYNVNR